MTLNHSYRPALAALTRDNATAGNDAGPLTVTLTLTLSGPSAAQTAQHLVTALADTPARDDGSVLDGFVVESAPAPTERAPLVIDTVSRSVRVDGATARFTRREYELLLYLAEHANAAFTRRQLLRAVWGHEFSGERTVDVHIRRIRAKLDIHGGVINTVHGFGYRLEDYDQLVVWRG